LAIVVTQVGYTTVSGDPQNLVDGNLSTGWTPAAQVPSGGLSIGFIQFDLQSDYTMTSFACVFANAGSFGSGTLLCSDFDATQPPFNAIHDGDQILGSYSGSSLGSGASQKIAPQTRPRRYFRLLGNADPVLGATDGTELFEFQFTPAVFTGPATPRVSQLAGEVLDTQPAARRVTTLAGEVLNTQPTSRRATSVAAEILNSQPTSRRVTLVAAEVLSSVAKAPEAFSDGDDDTLTAVLYVPLSATLSDGDSDALTATATITNSDDLRAAFTDGDSDALGIFVPRVAPIQISLMTTGR
jgi:hypothetical protein